MGLKRDEELGIVEPGRVGAVIGPAHLGHHELDFGVFFHDGPSQLCLLADLLERDVDWKRSADPHIAFFQLWHEFAAEERQRNGGRQRQGCEDADDRPPIVEKMLQLPQVAAL